MKPQKTVFEQYERYKKMGKSRGYGEKYKPGVTIRGVHSTGLSHRIKGWKTNRTHHFLSLLELHFFIRSNGQCLLLTFVKSSCYRQKIQ